MTRVPGRSSETLFPVPVYIDSGREMHMCVSQRPVGAGNQDLVTTPARGTYRRTRLRGWPERILVVADRRDEGCGYVWRLCYRARS